MKTIFKIQIFNGNHTNLNYAYSYDDDHVNIYIYKETNEVKLTSF